MRTLVIVSSLLCVMSASTARTDEVACQDVLEWDTGQVQFDEPRDVAVDSNEDVYVAEYGDAIETHQVRKFDSMGNFLFNIGNIGRGSGDGDFYTPAGLVVASGFVYVAESNNHRIQKLDSTTGDSVGWIGKCVDGTTCENFSCRSDNCVPSNGSLDGQFDRPIGVTVDSAGNLYVVERDNHRVQKFDSSGSFILSWGGTLCHATEGMDCEGEFHHPEDIAVDSSGNVYVADTDNHRIQEFTSAGTFIRKWGSFCEIGGNDPCEEEAPAEEGDGQFDIPDALAVDTNGDVYVADGFNDRMQRFNSSGGLLEKCGNQGPGPGQFSIPHGVDIGPSGAIYVADSNNKRIQKFASLQGHETVPGVPIGGSIVLGVLLASTATFAVRARSRRP